MHKDHIDFAKSIFKINYFYPMLNNPSHEVLGKLIYSIETCQCVVFFTNRF